MNRLFSAMLLGTILGIGIPVACSSLGDPETVRGITNVAIDSTLVEIDNAIKWRQEMYDRERDPRLEEEIMDLQKWRFYLDAAKTIGNDTILLLAKRPEG